MVKPGYRSPTIKESTYQKLEEIARTLNKTIPKTILYLCEEFAKYEGLTKGTQILKQEGMKP